ncbi:MAG: sugar nucleotide-binding protein, partial [Zoogloeaceae bacterium]|nr:sugar nucleotide-binding protein [Zoogloeaceae bacterium]
MRKLPRILVFGADGQVARELRRELSTVGELVVVGRTTPGLSADFAVPESLAAVVANARPQLIVNAAAFTAVDRAESEPALAESVNAVAPGVIAIAAREC